MKNTLKITLAGALAAGVLITATPSRASQTRTPSSKSFASS